MKKGRLGFEPMSVLLLSNSIYFYLICIYLFAQIKKLQHQGTHWCIFGAGEGKSQYGLFYLASTKEN